MRQAGIRQIANGSPGVYTYLRPGTDANIVCAANFSSSPAAVVATVDEAQLALSAPLKAERQYYMNDLLNQVAFPVTKATLAAFGFPLAASQSRVFLLADTAAYQIATGTMDAPELPATLVIGQIYPNPLHSSERGSATLVYSVPAAKNADGMQVTLTLVDAAGRELGLVDDAFRAPGRYSISFRISDAVPCASGLYFLRLRANGGASAGAPMQTVRPVMVLP